MMMGILIYGIFDKTYLPIMRMGRELMLMMIVVTANGNSDDVDYANDDIYSEADGDLLSHLPIMRMGREWAKQMKIQPVSRRGQHRRAIKRLNQQDVDD